MPGGAHLWGGASEPGAPVLHVASSTKEDQSQSIFQRSLRIS